MSLSISYSLFLTYKILIVLKITHRVLNGLISVDIYLYCVPRMTLEKDSQMKYA